MSFSTICIVGLGYIGLPTAAVFAGRRVRVVGVDINRATIDTINQGRIHIVEPDLDIAVHAAVTEGYLRATDSPEPADAFIIAVPTPFKADHQPDLRHVEAATKSVAPFLKKGDLVVLESTSPVGTTEQIATWLSELRPDLVFPTGNINADVHVAHCPERVLPGKIMTELINNDRVIGGITPSCAQKARDLYGLFVRGECFLTDARTAEMCKLTENSFRDVNVAFANELSMVCDRLSVDVWELIRLANRHPRVNILKPGPGVGGHCIAVDPWFIVSSAPEQAVLIRKAREVNNSKPAYVIDKVRNAAKQFEAPVIACLGLAFKANIDDLRESPALQIAQSLARDGIGKVLAVEPHVQRLPVEIHGITLTSLEHALDEANVVVVLVDHDAFRHNVVLGPHQIGVDVQGFLTRQS